MRPCHGARDLYERCLELDPSFAPAWAHLGRAHRVIGKYVVASPDSEARRRSGAEARTGTESAAGCRPSRLRSARGRPRTAAAGDGAAARSGPATRQRSRPVRRTRPGVPLLRPLRRVADRARGGPPPRPSCPHQRQRDVTARRSNSIGSSRSNGLRPARWLTPAIASSLLGTIRALRRSAAVAGRDAQDLTTCRSSACLPTFSTRGSSGDPIVWWSMHRSLAG